MDDKESPEPTEPPISSSKLEEQKVAIHTGASPEPKASLPVKTDVTEKAESTSARTVVVEQNDNLSRIIQRAYGGYKDSLLAKVLKENPEIRTPDYILVGQVIRLPELEPKDLND